MKKQFAVSFVVHFVAVSAVRLIAITTRQGECRCRAFKESSRKRLTPTPASATRMARVNGKRFPFTLRMNGIQNEEKVQQSQHRITTP